MEYSIFFFIAIAVTTGNTISAKESSHSYMSSNTFLKRLHNNVAGLSSDQPAVFSMSEQVPGEESNNTVYLDKQNIGPGGLGKVSGNFTDEVINNARQYLLITALASPAMQEALRQTLYARGMSIKKANEILEDVLYLLHSQLIQHKKRDWKRLSLQSRFALFGTKLVPGRKIDKTGATTAVLRYGRRSTLH